MHDQLARRQRHGLHRRNRQRPRAGNGRRAEVDPKVFTAINMHFTVSGRELPPAAVDRAIRMSHEKYCSASAMLAKTAAFTTSFEIVEA